MNKKLLLGGETGNYEVKDIAIVDRPERLKTVANKLSLQILRLLGQNEMYPIQIAKKLGVHEQKVYYHVRKLAEAGMIEVVREEEKKGATARFYKIAIQTGILDFANQEAVSFLHSEVKSMREQFRLHVRGEEHFIHPILKERLPSEARKLEEDHRSIDQQFDDLIVNLDAIEAASIDFEKRVK
jgi:predicted transcriptional regulator